MQLKAIESLPKTKAAVQVLKVLKLGSILQAEGRQETADADPQWHHSGQSTPPSQNCSLALRSLGNPSFYDHAVTGPNPTSR